MEQTLTISNIIAKMRNFSSLVPDDAFVRYFVCDCLNSIEFKSGFRNAGVSIQHNKEKPSMIDSITFQRVWRDTIINYLIEKFTHYYFKNWISQDKLYMHILEITGYHSSVTYKDFIDRLNKSELIQRNSYVAENATKQSLTKTLFINFSAIKLFIAEEYGELLHVNVKKNDLISAEALTRKFMISYEKALDLLRSAFDSNIDDHIVTCQNNKIYLKEIYLDYFVTIYSLQPRYEKTENMDFIYGKKTKVSLPRVEITSPELKDPDLIRYKVKPCIPLDKIHNPEPTKEDVVKNLIKVFILRHKDLEEERSSQYPDNARIERIKKIIRSVIDILKTQSVYVKRYINKDISVIAEKYDTGNFMTCDELVSFFEPKISYAFLWCHAR